MLCYLYESPKVKLYSYRLPPGSDKIDGIKIVQTEPSLKIMNCKHTFFHNKPTDKI